MNKKKCLELYNLLNEKNLKIDLQEKLKQFLTPTEEICNIIFGRRKRYSSYSRAIEEKLRYFRKRRDYKLVIELCRKSQNIECRKWVSELLNIDIDYDELMIEMSYLEEYGVLSEYDDKIQSFYFARQKWLEEGQKNHFISRVIQLI